MFRLIKVFIVILTLFSGLNISQAKAQMPIVPADIAQPQVIIQNQYQSKFMYKRWAMKAQAHKSGEFPFEKLVIPYSKGPDYDPYATETLKELYNHAFKAQTSKSLEEIDEAMQSFEGLLNDHLGNYNVVNAALILIRDNKNLGNVEFLSWLRNGLAQRALNSGRGIDVYSAYDIYSVGEEDLILSSLNADVINTETITDGSEFYHIHEYKDRVTGSVKKAYIRFSGIMRGVIAKKQIENPFYRFELEPNEGFELELELE